MRFLLKPTGACEMAEGFWYESTAGHRTWSQVPMSSEELDAEWQFVDNYFSNAEPDFRD